jgi:hypothetical protein
MTADNPPNALEALGDYVGARPGLLAERDELERLVLHCDTEIERLRAALRDVIFNLHNCKYGGDMPRCGHIADALNLARATNPYGPVEKHKPLLARPNARAWEAV